jgi:hypothetical protein
MEFKKAERKQAKLRLALTGPSGSGKTWSALLIASGIGKKIALIDTENHSASLYAGEKEIPPFDALEIDPPYTISKYNEAIRAAIDAKYEVLIIDSITHAWAGEGGILDKKAALDARGGNTYTNWSGMTKEHEQFKSALLNCGIHLIVSMRSKQDYILEETKSGKMAPRKVGLAPIQREGMEYEFTMVLDMAMDHNASISKTRVHSFDGRVFKPSKKTGEELLTWLHEGKESEPEVNKAVEALQVTNGKGSNVIIPTGVSANPAKGESKAFWTITDISGEVLFTQEEGIAQMASFCIDKKNSMRVDYEMKKRSTGDMVKLIVDGATVGKV